MDKQPFDHAFTFKDDLEVRETFADGIGLITVDATTAKITLTVSRPDSPKPGQKGPPKGQKVVVSRLVLPTPAFATLFNQMNSLIHELEARGLFMRDGGALKPTVQ